MRPVLLHVGGYVIYSHAVFVALGIAVALVTSWRIARRAGRADQDFLLVIAGGLVGAAILARYGLVFRYLLDARDPSLAGFLTPRASWGFGIRWLSPMGPLRFEWGFPFKPLPHEQRSLFEFTVGGAF